MKIKRAVVQFGTDGSFTDVVVEHDAVTALGTSPVETTIRVPSIAFVDVPALTAAVVGAVTEIATANARAADAPKADALPTFEILPVV